MADGKLKVASGSRVSQAQFAQLRGVDRSTVTLWKRKGLLVVDEESGLLDVAASNAKLDARPPTYRGGKTAARTDAEAEDAAAAALRQLQADGQPMTMAQATLLKETYLAKLRQLEYDQLSGEVVAISDVVAEIASVLTAVKHRFLGLAPKLAPRFPDPAFARALIGAEVLLILSELSADEADDADQ